MNKQKSGINRFAPLLIAGLYFLLFGLAVYCVDYFSKEEITEVLKKAIPWTMRINFLLILAGLVVCGRDIRRAIQSFRNRRGATLIVLLLLCFLAVSFLAPRIHRIFYDEDIYANVGQNIALDNQTGYCNYGTFEYDEYKPHWMTYNKEPSGWPFLISAAFQLFGVNELYTFLLNNLFFCTGLATAFFITWRLSSGFMPGLLAALALAFIPHNLTWSNTGAAEPSAALFAGLTILAAIVYLQSLERRHLFLLAALLPFACQLRPESILIVPLVFLAFILLQPRQLLKRELWAFGLPAALFLLPELLHLYAVSDHSWGAPAANFSLEFLANNLSVNGLYYLNNREFPALFTLLALSGLLAGRCQWRWRLLLLCWFLCFWGLFLFFYAGSYKYGADVRFSLLSFVPLAVLAGLGADLCRQILTRLLSRLESAKTLANSLVLLVMLYTLASFLPLIRQVGQEAWGARYDHLYARQFIDKIPKRSVILTHNPNMFLLWGRGAIQTQAGVNNQDLISDLLNRYRGEVYFHYNYWCNTDTERNQRLCQSIAENYNLEETVRAQEQNYEYVLYKMSLKEKKQVKDET